MEINYLRTKWTKQSSKGERDTYTNPAIVGRLLVQGSRGVVMGSQGFKKVQVEARNNQATITHVDAKTCRAGHEVKEWLAGKESERNVELRGG